LRERTLNRLAEAIRDNGRRIVQEDVVVPQRAVVLDNNPLQVELTHGRLVLDNEDLIVSQSVRRYHHDVGINVGDEVLLIHVEGHEWIVAVVISPGDTWPSGGGGGDLNYVHNQVAASALWTVTHNLGKFPAVSVVDTGGNELIADVTYITLNQVTVGFGAPTSGKVYVN
jgi:hypothetical protein